MPASYDWIYPALGYPLAALALLWLLLALFRDRSRGRRRCPRCWYDLAGVPSLTCPECGRTVRSERRLLKTRRRYRRAALATLLLLAGLAVTLVPAYERGWPTAVPGWLLVRIAEPRAATIPAVTFTGPVVLTPAGSSAIVLTPPAPTTSESLVRETWDRFNNAGLSRSQYRCWLLRCMRAAHADLTDAFTIPDAWPQHADLQVLCNLPNFPGSELLEVHLRAPDLGPEWVVPEPASLSGPRSYKPILLPPGHHPSDQLRLEIRLVGAYAAPGARTRMGGTPTAPPNALIAGQVIYAADLNFPIRIRGDRINFLDAIAGPAADARVLAVLDPRITDAEGYLRLTWDNTSGESKWRDVDFGICFAAEFRVDERPVGRALGNTHWGHIFWRDWEDTPIAWNLDGRVAFERALAGDPGAGTPRIILRADPARAGAAYLFNPFNKPRPACWTGTLDVPARLAPRPRTSSRDP